MNKTYVQAWTASIGMLILRFFRPEDYEVCFGKGKSIPFNLKEGEDLKFE